MSLDHRHGNGDWTDDPRDLLRVGEGFDLAAFDRSATPGWGSGKTEARDHMTARGELMSELQERLFAEGRNGGSRSLLVVVQGLDTAGKGGVTRHVMSMVDPQGVALRSFGVPSAEERRHHYLWRIRRALPRPGLIGVFDRSHYEDVLVVRVDELVERDVWEKRYDEINRFEKSLIDAGTTVIKFALMVGYEEQGLRLMERLDRRDKHWKFSTNDLVTRSKWQAYQEAYQAVFSRTSTDAAPWYVLPADRKWYARLAITEIVVQTLLDMDPQWPRPRWREATQRTRLAATMSTASLAESLADTEEVVKGAIAENLQFEEAAAVAASLGDDDPVTKAEREAARVAAQAVRAEGIARLEAMREQKAELLDAREDAPAKPSKKKKGKGKGKGKK